MTHWGEEEYSKPSGVCPACGHPVWDAARSCPGCGNTDFTVLIDDVFWESCRHCKGIGKVTPEKGRRTGPQICGYCQGSGVALYQKIRDARTDEESRVIVHPKLRPNR
jgi:DnaJ-class molecular chaperone